MDNLPGEWEGLDAIAAVERKKGEFAMRRLGIRPFIIVIAIVFFVLFFSRETGQSKALTPETSSITDEATAIAIGRRVAGTALAENTKADQIILESVKRVSSEEYRQERVSSGVGPASTILQQLTGDFWIVTFNGFFTPKRRTLFMMHEERPVYTTLIVYIEASTGDVPSVRMHSK